MEKAEKGVSPCMCAKAGLTTTLVPALSPYPHPDSSILPLVPKVGAALWERTRETKLRFGGGRERMGTAIEVVVRRKGDGVSPRRAFPKRCANFGNETKNGIKLRPVFRVNAWHAIPKLRLT
jgi:hypothetical protein